LPSRNEVEEDWGMQWILLLALTGYKATTRWDTWAFFPSMSTSSPLLLYIDALWKLLLPLLAFLLYPLSESLFDGMIVVSACRGIFRGI
jgi:hypothetical protein